VNRHIIYIPGLGDRYDPVRRACLLLWRRPGIKISLVPMAWLDTDDRYDQKMARVEQAIRSRPNDQVVLVGESAGGSMVIAALRRDSVRPYRAVTICGMNHGAANVSPTVYRRNPGFRDAMKAADEAYDQLTEPERSMLLVLFSSLDFTVRPAHSLVPGAESHDMRVPGHMFAIFAVLLWQYRKIIRLP
jgi:pimeloyl-ACP methyl ester carboxylesterase